MNNSDRIIDPNPLARLESRRFDPLKWVVCALLFAGKKEGLPREESGSDGEAENPAPDMKEDFLSIDSFSEKNDSYDGI